MVFISPLVNRLPRRSIARVFLLSVLVMTCQAQAEALSRFRAFVESTQSVRADFEQKVHDRNGKLVQSATGYFTLLRPSRFRGSYAKPYAQLIVGDGERVWTYDEDLNQVTVRRMSRALGNTPAALLAGNADLERSFVFAEAPLRDGLEWLEATPRDRESGFELIRMGFSATGLEAMELMDHFGQTTRLRFLSLQRNPKVESSSFRFVPPKGADVLGTP